jgi:hypothetical protein
MIWVLHYGSYCTSTLNNLFDKRLSSVWLLKVFRTGSVAAEKMLAHKVEISKLLCAAIAVETEIEVSATWFDGLLGSFGEANCLFSTLNIFTHLTTFALGTVTTSSVKKRLIRIMTLLADDNF